MEDKKSYFAVIPANVRYDDRLSSSEKLLYGEIIALCNEKGYCWASNNYFARLYGVTAQAVSKWVINLEKTGYISIGYKYKPNTKEIENRIIKMVSINFDEVSTNVSEVSINVSEVSINVDRGYQKKFKENNTSMNNISFSKEKNTKKEKQTFITEFLDSIDNAELREAYSDFIDMRKEIKAPITTERMLNTLAKKVNILANDTTTQIELLNEAIFNKWRSVYPIKPKNAIQGKTGHNYGCFDLEEFEKRLNND